MRTLGFLILLCLLIWLGWFGYQHYQTTRGMGSGAVHCEGCMSGEEKAAFLRENSGEGPDGQSEHKWDFSRGPNGEKLEYSRADDPRYKGDGFTPDQRTAPPETRAYGEPSYYGGTYADGGTTGRGDTIPPNPPNGERFGGRGTYQWYRQGNITWRTDTVSGQSCIAYATEAEWRKRNVIEHGCGRM